MVHFTQLFNTNSVSRGILKYLDGSALLNLSSVSKEIREVTTSSNDYKNKINLRVEIKTTAYFITMVEPLPLWTANLAHLTLVCNSVLVINTQLQKNIVSLAKTLPSLSTLVVVNNSPKYTYAKSFLDNILNLSSNLKSLSLPYDFMLNPIICSNIGQNLKELKFTTSTYKVRFNKFFDQNLAIFASNCINLKKFSCQELVKVQGKYVNDYEKDYKYHKFFNRIFTIVENNSLRLETLEFGISTLILDPRFYSKFNEISLPNLEFLELRAITPLHFEEPSFYYSNPNLYQTVLDILIKLPHPEKLSTLKLTLTRFPIELFGLIPKKFDQIKSLSLKSSKYFPIEQGYQIINQDDNWSFLQYLIQLEELEISRFILDEMESNFGLEINEQFPEFLQNNYLRKLSLEGMNELKGYMFFNGIATMRELKELRLTGASLYLKDFLTICLNLKLLEKLEISRFHDDKLKPQYSYSATGQKIDYPEVLTALSSLKFLKELSIEVWYGDFRELFRALRFPYLKSLTLCNANLSQEDIENIIGLNELLKELTIISLNEENVDQVQNLEILNDRKNLKIQFSNKEVEMSPSGCEKVVEDSDPDSRALIEQNIRWPDYEYGFDDEVFGDEYDYNYDD